MHSFPPEHFPTFRHRDLFGGARKNSPVTSPFAMFSGSYPWIMDGNLATHSSIVSLFTSLDSPQSSLKTIGCLLRKLSNHPLYALNSVFPSFLPNFLAYSCTIESDTRRFFSPTLTNLSHTISLTSSFAVFLSTLFIFPLAYIFQGIKISVFFFRISYT